MKVNELEILKEEIPIYKSKYDKHSPRKRSGNCPVCLSRLRKNIKNTRYERKCNKCGAVLQKNIKCSFCDTNRVWMSRKGNYCKGCGNKYFTQIHIK
jgi:hypothetical protein